MTNGAGLLFERSKSHKNYENWLADQHWFKHEDEYSLLFEAIYDQPSQRRVYIEECVKNAHPSWGYVYLTNLLANQYFDVVFTTNFDDLMNEACYLYSDGLRPIVAAHDSAIQGIRITSGRPKIIKLHGDFLYDNIKNTLAELETLETNTKRKLNQFAQEYGLVVMGYSGRDRSVMDTLELLLRDEESFKQGVYWCARRGEEKSGRLESLLRKDRVYFVQIDGFDEFMAELNAEAKLALPKPIERPFDMARDRARLFIEVGAVLKSHPIISSHVRAVLQGINATHRPHLPPQVEALMLSSRGDYDEAISILQQVLSEDPKDESISHLYADTLASAGKTQELAAFIPKSAMTVDNKIYFLLRIGQNQRVLDLSSEILNAKSLASDEESVTSEVVRINRAIALKKLGKIDEMNADLDYLEQKEGPRYANLRAGIAALRGNKEEMLALLKDSLHKTITPEHLMEFPVFEDYRNDPNFVELVKAPGESQILSKT